MNHVGPDFQRDIDVGGTRGGGKPRGVGKQGLGRPDLDQDRRKAVQVGE